MAWESFDPYSGNSHSIGNSMASLSTSSSSYYDSAGESDYSSSSRSRDTKSLDNLSMAIYDGSYTGSSDSRWHSNGDGTYSFGNNDESNSSKYDGASSSGYSFSRRPSYSDNSHFDSNNSYFDSNFGRRNAITSAVANHRSLTNGAGNDPKATTLSGQKIDEQNGLLARSLDLRASRGESAQRERFDLGWNGKSWKENAISNLPSVLEANEDYKDLISNPERDYIANNPITASRKAKSLSELREIAVDTIKKQHEAKQAGNAISAVTPALGLFGKGIGNLVTTAGSSALGYYAPDIAKSAVGEDPRLNNLTEEEKKIVDYNLNKYNKAYEKNSEVSWGNWQNGAAKVLGAVVDTGAGMVGAPFSVGSTFANAYINEKAHEAALKKLGTPAAMAAIKARDEARKKRAEAEEWEAFTKSDQPQNNHHGILSSIAARNRQPQQPTLPYYAIPALTNLWNNVIVK